MEHPKELKKTFSKNGFFYEQIYAGDAGYIYAKFYAARIVSYEAFKRRINTQFNCVSMPGNEAFGIWAWDCHTINGAVEVIGATDFTIIVD